jgi:AcrR family transcriptional regulator
MKDMNEKQNRKIRYTKMVLRESLMELMKTKNILRITIKDLCDTADICRTTFYAHYKDQYDLLEQVQEETLTYFEDMLDKFNAANKNPASPKGNRQMVEEVLQYIANSGNTIQVLLSENGSSDFQNKIFSHLTQNMQRLKKHTVEKPEDKKKALCYSVFMIHGTAALIQYWLKNKMDIPISELAKMLINLTQELWE